MQCVIDIATVFLGGTISDFINVASSTVAI